jgi:hypothetical protein
MARTAKRGRDTEMGPFVTGQEESLQRPRKEDSKKKIEQTKRKR